MTGYSEHSFQHAWSRASMRLTGLMSDTGHRVDVIHAGTWNHHSGPDFLDARVSIDGRLFHGGIELHRDPSEWYSHGHHLDAVYNQVVLHVAPVSAKRPIVRQDGTRVPHISLSRIMPGWLPQSTKAAPTLACEKIIHRNQDALVVQLEEASAHYFEELTGRLLSRIRPGHDFAPELLRSMAVGVGSIYGAPANRDSMAEAAALMWDLPSTTKQDEALRVLTSQLHWRDHCGRPATYPERRLAQLWDTVAQLKRLDPHCLVQSAARVVAKIILGSSSGSHTGKVTHATVILPACWLMACMSGNHEIAASVRQSWDVVSLPAAPEAAKAFGSILAQIDPRHHKAITWLHRNKCQPKRCAGCRVGNRMVS